MLKGLEQEDARPDFILNMATFGHVQKRLSEPYVAVMGCAATCAIGYLTGLPMQITDHHQDGWLSRISILHENQPKSALAKAMSFFDHLRRGNYSVGTPWAMGSIIVGFKDLPEEFESMPCLYADSWKDDRPMYDAFVEYLKSIDM